MRYSIPVKFLAVALSAIALVAGFASVLGIVQVAELGLYTDGFDGWVDNRLERQAYGLAEDLTERYAVRQLTNCSDEVLEELCGRNVYFDTAMCCERVGMTSAMGRALVAAHGANRILFGSDLPWARPAEILSFLDTWGLTAEEKDAILRKNAKSLLRL